MVRTSQKPQYVLFSTLSYLIAVLVWLFVWEKNSGATALFDDGTFNENPMRFLKIAFFFSFLKQIIKVT